MDTDIVIAGGGPVGMTLALELARYGVRSILLERNPGTTRHPKMDLTNGRSMELFARLGIVESLRDAGVPRDNPFDISWVTDMHGHELYRFEYPSSSDYAAESRKVNDGSYPAEAPLRVSQIDIEPVLKSFVDASDLVDVRFGIALEEIVSQDERSIRVRIKDSASGAFDTLESKFLAGCDGGGSRVRRKLGIELEGDENAAGAFMVHFRSTDTDLLQRWGTTWHYQNGTGTVIAQNDKDTWTLQAWLPPGDDGSDWQAEQVLETWMGGKFDYEILAANPWYAHFVVAREYVKGRAVLAGDSAHQFIPTGGYGMNSGIADAAGLGWVLAANVQGWGGSALLTAYEAERHPTAWMHLNAARRHFMVRQQFTEAYMQAGDIHSESDEAASNRKALAARVQELGNAENESWGVELGYCYQSPAILSDNEPAELDPLNYRPMPEPGCRLPHFFLDDGNSVHRRLGKYFNLVVSGQPSDQERLPEAKNAAEQLGVPLEIVTLNTLKAKAIYQYAYLLVRPDLHIAWRGNALPDDVTQTLAVAAGRG